MSARVLVVEDEETMAGVLSAYLTRAGYESLWAPDGMEALTIWSRVKPDVVMLDILLPTISGPEVLRRRRASADDAAVKVAALRFHNVYGPGLPIDTPYAGVATLFRSRPAHGDPATGVRGR